MPEGDPLSCLGMILCDFYFHCYFSRYLPSIYVFSYVDNLSLISTQAPLLVQGGTGFPSLAPNAGLVAGSQKKAMGGALVHRLGRLWLEVASLSDVGLETWEHNFSMAPKLRCHPEMKDFALSNLYGLCWLALALV